MTDCKARVAGSIVKIFRPFIVLLFLLPFTTDLFGQGDSIARHSRVDTTLVLDEVEVVAFQVRGTLRDITGSMAVLSGAGITRSDATNLATTINMIPGVTMQSGTYATSRIVIRGMGSRTPYNTNRIKSYLNGIPLTSSDGVSSPEEVDLQSIGRIEVIKGPASALFGSGLGGSVNMYTPSYEPKKQALGLQYGSYNTVHTQLSGTLNGKESSYWGSISQLQSDGYRENSQYKRTSVLSTAQWKKQGWSVDATILLTGINGEIPSSLDQTTFDNHPEWAAPAWKAVSGYKQTKKMLSGITLTSKLTEHTTNQLTVFGKLNDSYEKRPFNNLDDQSASAGFRNKLSYMTDHAEWIFGTEWIADQYKWKLIKEEQLINENSENRMNFSVFGMVYYQPSPKMHLTFANAFNYTRYRLADMFPANGDQSGKREFPLIISPRAGINYSLNDFVAFYASVGHGYSLPSPEETLLPAGDINPEIKPEQGFQYEIGARMNLLGKTMWLDATLYRIELNNLLVTKRVDEDIFTGMNAGKTRHQGAEIMVNNLFFDFRNFPGKLTSQFSYTISLNRFIDFTDSGNTYDGNDLPGIPDQSVQHQLTWMPFKKMELTTHFYYTGDQYLNDSNSLKYGGYFLGNLKMSLILPVSKSRTFQVYGGINNLADNHYASMLVVNAVGFGNSAPRYFYPGLPRHGYAGIRLLF